MDTPFKALDVHIWLFSKENLMHEVVYYLFLRSVYENKTNCWLLPLSFSYGDSVLCTVPIILLKSIYWFNLRKKDKASIKSL